MKFICWYLASFIFPKEDMPTPSYFLGVVSKSISRKEKKETQFHKLNPTPAASL
jgi:hypothetical protein